MGIGSKEDLSAFLKSDEAKAEVAQGISNAQRLGINGVPFFVRAMQCFSFLSMHLMLYNLTFANRSYIATVKI